MRRRQALAQNPDQFRINTVRTTTAPAQRPVEAVSRPDVNIQGVDYEDMSYGSLESCYLVVFGKKPHHRMKRETIVRNLYVHAG